MTRKLDHTTPKGFKARLPLNRRVKQSDKATSSRLQLAGKFLDTELLGDHSAADPPVPIPNTEVKCSDADGSATYDCARVGHRQA